MSAQTKPDIDSLLAALADPARRKTIELLGRAPRRAGELAELLDLPAPAMSRHLKALKASGLIAETHPEFDARVRVYSLNSGPLSDLKDWLSKAEAGWTSQLAAFARHVEKRKAR